MSLSAHQRIRRAMEAKRNAQAQAESQDVPDKAMANVTPEDIAKMKLPELKKFAEEHSIVITGLKKAEDLRMKILEVVAVTNDDEAPTDDTPPEGDNPEVNQENNPPDGDTSSKDDTPPDGNAPETSPDNADNDNPEGADGNESDPGGN